MSEDASTSSCVWKRPFHTVLEKGIGSSGSSSSLSIICHLAFTCSKASTFRTFRVAFFATPSVCVATFTVYCLPFRLTVKSLNIVGVAVIIVTIIVAVVIAIVIVALAIAIVIVALAIAIVIVALAIAIVIVALAVAIVIVALAVAIVIVALVIAIVIVAAVSAIVIVRAVIIPIIEDCVNNLHSK